MIDAARVKRLRELLSLFMQADMSEHGKNQQAMSTVVIMKELPALLDMLDAAGRIVEAVAEVSDGSGPFYACLFCSGSRPMGRIAVEHDKDCAYVAAVAWRAGMTSP